ncbi:MAG: PadR family transcriptional regulator [Candidatus Heimdallarchaeota archaeon]
MSIIDETEFLSDFSRFQVLLLLYEQPRHGYDILSEFRKRIGKEISPSLVYPFLQQLQEKGLVTVSVKKIGKKEKKVYELTTEGQTLCEHLFKRFSKLVSTAIEPNLDTCANCGSKIFEGSHIETVTGQKMVFCCEHCAKAYLVERGILGE